MGSLGSNTRSFLPNISLVRRKGCSFSGLHIPYSCGSLMREVVENQVALLGEGKASATNFWKVLCEVVLAGEWMLQDAKKVTP